VLPYAVPSPVCWRYLKSLPTSSHVVQGVSTLLSASMHLLVMEVYCAYSGPSLFHAARYTRNYLYVAKFCIQPSLEKVPWVLTPYVTLCYKRFIVTFRCIESFYPQSASRILVASIILVPWISCCFLSRPSRAGSSVLTDHKDKHEVWSSISL